VLYALHFFKVGLLMIPTQRMILRHATTWNAPPNLAKAAETALKDGDEGGFEFQNMLASEITEAWVKIKWLGFARHVQ